jgi:hypothetical protein
MIVIVLGAGLGFAVSTGRMPLLTELPLASYLVGLAWAWILVQGVLVLKDALAFADPVPVSIPLGDRAALRETIAAMKAGGRLAGRARHLLNSWTEGLSPDQVIGLANFQSQQNRNAAYAGLSFGLILLAAAAWQQANTSLTVIGFAALALVHGARQALDRQGDHYLESRILSRLPGNLPNTLMTADELAESLSKAVNGTFEKYMPKPDQIASAIQGPVESMSRETMAQLENVGRAMTAGYEKLQGALDEHAQAMSQSGASMGQELQQVLQSHASQLENTSDTMGRAVAAGYEQLQGALNQHAQSVTQGGAAMGQNLEQVLQNHAAQLQQASDTIGSQLSRISELQENIGDLLRVQEAIDGTLKAVTTTDEFKETITSLRTHLEDSDKLLREIAKPRTIRLVESDEE